MALDSSSSRTRSITAIGAGAVLFAVIGYLLLNKNRKKPKKKSKSNTQVTNFENMRSILAVSPDYLSKTKKNSFSDDQKVPNMTESSSLENSSQQACCSSNIDSIISEKDLLRICHSDCECISRHNIKVNNDLDRVSELNRPIETSSPLDKETSFFEVNNSTEVKDLLLQYVDKDDKKSINSDSQVPVQETKSINAEEFKSESNNNNNDINNTETVEKCFSDSSEEIHHNDYTSNDESQTGDGEIETEIIKIETENASSCGEDSAASTPRENLISNSDNNNDNYNDSNNISIKENQNQVQINLIKSASSSSASSDKSTFSESTGISHSSYGTSPTIFPSQKEQPKPQPQQQQQQVPQQQQKTQQSVPQQTKPTVSKRPTKTPVKQNTEVKKPVETTNTKSKKVVNKSPNTNNNNNNNSSESNKIKNTESENSPAKPTDSDKTFEDLVVYEFNFPRKLCGKLIGKNGVHVDFIRSKTHTQIAVRNDPNVEDLQIVCVSGRLEDVDHALDIIRTRFPAKHYPQISFKPITKPIIYRRYNPEKSVSFNGSKVLVAPNMFVDLTSIKDTNSNGSFNVYVSAVVTAAHVFIQLPTNSTYENLQKLDENMIKLYNNQEEKTPLMIEPIEYGTICVAPTSYGWHRAMVTNYMSKTDAIQYIPNYSEACGLATVKFLDYGGYLTVPTDQLRQLRSDFMVLPFQAIECYLDGIYPLEGTEEEGKNFLTELIKNSTLKANISGYSPDGIPVIKLFLYNHSYEGLDVNSEIVNCRFAYNLNDDLNVSQKENYTNDSEQLATVPQTV